MNIRRLSILVLKTFLFLFVIDCNITIFITWTSYTKLPTMLADISVEPFEAFLIVSYLFEAHMALIACGIGHAHMKVPKIRFPV